jgi:hypothetical protein
VKIYVAAVQVLSENERQDETEFTTKIDGFLEFTQLECKCTSCMIFLNLTTLSEVLCFPYFTDKL